jgi:hypothetical protein
VGIGVLAVLGLVTFGLKFFGVPYVQPDCENYRSVTSTSASGSHTATIKLSRCREGYESKIVSDLIIADTESGETESISLPFYVGNSGHPSWNGHGDLVVDYPDPANDEPRPREVGDVWVEFSKR